MKLLKTSFEIECVRKIESYFKKDLTCLNVQCTTQNIPGSSCIGAYFFSFSLVLSLLHTTTTGYVQRQDKVSHWLPQWEIFEVKYWCFFIKSWWKEMKGHCIELNCFTWCKTISHKLGNMYQNFGTVNFFRDDALIRI